VHIDEDDHAANASKTRSTHVSGAAGVGRVRLLTTVGLRRV
jgi:hypothetical protein